MKTPQLSHNFTLCNIRILYLLAVLPALISCSSGDDDTIEQQNTCNSGKNLINSFENEHGTNLIYEDGKYFILNNDTCEFILQYFDPNYLEVNYTNTTQGIFVGTNPNELIPITNNNIEDLEGYTSFSDLFLLSFDMPEKFWTSMTLLSPATPTITEYSALKNCILNNTCDFIDNKIELINDPSNAANTAIQFSAVAPSPELVTSKASIPSTLAYFIKNNEIWYEADYYLKEGMPYSLIDLENGYFLVVRDPELSLKMAC